MVLWFINIVYVEYNYNISKLYNNILYIIIIIIISDSVDDRDQKLKYGI